MQGKQVLSILSQMGGSELVTLRITVFHERFLVAWCQLDTFTDRHAAISLIADGLKETCMASLGGESVAQLT